MFEILKNDPENQTTAVYYAMRLLNGTDIPWLTPESWRVAFRWEGITPTVEALIAEIIAEIETREGKRLADLTQEQTKYHVGLLGDVSAEIRERERGPLSPETEARYQAALREIANMGIASR